MEFPRAIFLEGDDPARISITSWDVAAIDELSPAALGQLAHVLKKFGRLSGRAQGLPAPVTDLPRLVANRHLMLLAGQCASAPTTWVLGGLKIGSKKLFLHPPGNAQFLEVNAICVLDFYVHESCQRSGIGAALLEAYLKASGKTAAMLAYDRPSPKLRAFLAKHYGLVDFVPQNNNYVVFNDFFATSAAEAIRRGSANLEASASIANSARRFGLSVAAGGPHVDPAGSTYDTSVSSSLQNRTSSSSSRAAAAAEHLAVNPQQHAVGNHSSTHDRLQHEHLMTPTRPLGVERSRPRPNSAAVPTPLHQDQGQAADTGAPRRSNCNGMPPGRVVGQSMVSAARSRSLDLYGIRASAVEQQPETSSTGCQATKRSYAGREVSSAMPCQTLSNPSRPSPAPQLEARNQQQQQQQQQQQHQAHSVPSDKPCEATIRPTSAQQGEQAGRSNRTALRPSNPAPEVQRPQTLPRKTPVLQPPWALHISPQISEQQPSPPQIQPPGTTRRGKAAVLSPQPVKIQF